jgi:Protein of unknown function (DUF1254)
MHRLTALIAAILTASLLGCEQPKRTPATQTSDTGYTFDHSFPSGDTASKAYDDTDLNTAITAYKFFYPTVSIAATWKGNAAAGLTTNNQFIILEGSPKQLVFTPNSDTPYEGANIDLTNGPMVVELPPGPLMCVVNDMNQRTSWTWACPVPTPAKVASTSSCLPAIRVRSRAAISRELPPPITYFFLSVQFLHTAMCRPPLPC